VQCHDDSLFYHGLDIVAFSFIMMLLKTFRVLLQSLRSVYFVLVKVMNLLVI